MVPYSSILIHRVEPPKETSVRKRSTVILKEKRVAFLSLSESLGPLCLPAVVRLNDLRGHRKTSDPTTLTPDLHHPVGPVTHPIKSNPFLKPLA